MRLTNEKRRAIKRALLEHRFKKDIAGLKKRRAKLGDTVYAAVYTPQERSRMNRLPDGWMRKSRDFQVIRGRHEVICLKTSSPQPFPFSAFDNGGYNGPHVGTCPKSVADDLDSVVDGEEKIRRETSELERKIDGVLYSTSTVKALISKWPEAESIIVAACGNGAAPVTALAVKTKELNKALNLPPADAGKKGGKS